jgi:hypothetical protein
MRGLACICCVAVLVGCADTREEPDAAAGDTLGMTPPPAPGAPAAGAISLADVAGTWNVRAVAENSDSVVTYTLTADADSSWSMQFTGRPDMIPLQVLAVGGDSIVTHAGPFPSALRQGVMVTTHSVFRLEGGRLVGQTVARYTTTGPDSVLIVRSEGTRSQ